jgi:hypothetical protein
MSPIISLGNWGLHERAIPSLGKVGYLFVAAEVTPCAPPNRPIIAIKIGWYCGGTIGIRTPARPITVPNSPFKKFAFMDVPF